jgi:hypothetical protein
MDEGKWKLESGVGKRRHVYNELLHKCRRQLHSIFQFATLVVLSYVKDRVLAISNIDLLLDCERMQPANLTNER